MAKRNINQRIKTCCSRGFTLVELLIVLVISVTIITLSTVAYGKLSTNAYLKSSARHIAASLRYARSFAVAQGVDSIFKIDLSNRTYSFTGNQQLYQIKNNINLTTYSASVLSANKKISEIRFAPDGSSSGGRISLFSSNKKYIVYVDWLTGRVVIDHE